MQAEVADKHSAAVPGSNVVWRLRMVAICVGLTALTFLQEPGTIAVDTKADLTLNPAGWLQGALHLWDPSSAFGQ